ncbi:CaiB/BaiF CoA transferase family protein [Sphingomicrobium clamense]|uniref:CoA transferase n=1 Tax=Sphingomicrobium clamense TaxID=2851013 RepID=A0ABS6V700_9SPHN|nr:CaiB/BaiF CoA-transferase family protein [Sphingomicrobium sp. B8]MBW0145345.1 CoA transferase [Sphingomicrobium sp. B8]
MAGPLHGIRIIELAGLGPAPFCGMLLADHGADVIRIERAGLLSIPNDPTLRGRRSLALDLRREDARDAMRKLVVKSDALIDPYRPGKLETLGLGPGDLHAIKPELVIGRLTGWGQHGPLSERAGHDIDYLALSGMLSLVGPADGRPTPPANLVADYAGGALMLAFAMTAALREVAAGAGEGRVIDCAMSEASAYLGTFLYGMRNAGLWRDEREANLLDGGAGLYGTYACADGRYLAIGAIEPAFRNALVEGLGLSGDPLFSDSLDPSQWPAQREAVAVRIAQKNRDEWLAIFEGADACVAPVLSMAEAPADPHNRARDVFLDTPHGPLPTPAPRYGKDPEPLAEAREAEDLLAELGYSPDQIATLLDNP